MIVRSKSDKQNEENVGLSSAGEHLLLTSRGSQVRAL